MTKTKLLVGPWVGEFGWELFCWQGMARRDSCNYDETTVLCRAGNEHLYSDFATEIMPIKGLSQDTDCEQCFNFGRVEGVRLASTYPSHVWLNPFDNYTTRKLKIPFIQDQIHRRFRDTTAVYDFDLAIHARAAKKRGTGNRNWPVSKWIELIDLLHKWTRNQWGGDANICCIGTKEAAYHIPGTTDLRGVDLRTTCKVLSGSRVVIGPSSGPMHLAALTSTPLLTWSGTNRNVDRYETVWNPFDSKAIVLDPKKSGWDPTVELVWESLENLAYEHI